MLKANTENERSRFENEKENTREKAVIFGIFKLCMDIENAAEIQQARFLYHCLTDTRDDRVKLS